MKINTSTTPPKIMKLAVIFLNKTEYLEDLLAAFLEVGISGATVIDSVGMGHIISQNIPIFAGLREAFTGSSPNNKLILVVVEAEMIKRINEVLSDVCEEADETKSYFMATLPIEGLFGFNRE
jgi:nitrogen regulatory protein P-II 1